MSNVYILPRNQPPQQQQRRQPQQHLLVAGQQRPLLPATTTATTRVIRTSSHLLGAGNHRRVLRSQPYPTTVEEKPMGRPGFRRVYLAQPNSNLPAYPPMIGHHQHSEPAFGRPIFTVSPMDQQQSEEDEFDVEEVYRLLEESAGHRMEQDAGALPPRRRQRLTNLTAEEKMDRRKEKNRIAAQAARDRKKEMNKRLEDSLKKALLEIGRLKSEVKFLRAENAQLQMQQQPMQQHQKMQMHQQQPIMNVHRPHHQQPKPAATAIGQNAVNVNHCASQQPQQQSEDSLGSAASFNEPQPWERESDNSSRSDDEQLQRHQLANNNNGIRHNSNTRQCPLLKEMGIGQKQHKKMGKGTAASNEQKLRMACMMKVNNINYAKIGYDGSLVNCDHPEGGNGEDFKLQHIFDELFQELDIPVDVDRFCNEVIEEGIAAQNVGHGHGQIAEIVSMSAATIGGTFDGNKSEGPRKAEIATMPIDAYGREGGEEYGFQNGNGGRGGGGGNGHCATVEAALSPHNYFARPPQEEQQKNYLNQSSSDSPQSEQHSFSSNPNSNYSQQQHFYSTIDNSPHQTVIVADTAFQQMVPSPNDDQPFSAQNSPFDFDDTLDFDNHYGQMNGLDDQMFYGEESKGFGHSMDFENNGIFGHGNNDNSLLEWPDHSEDFATLEANGIGGDALGLPFQSDDLSTDLLLSNF